MGKDTITKEILYAAIVERILQEEQRFKVSPYELMKEVCKKRFNRDLSKTGINEFEVYNLIIYKAKENNYTVRKAPTHGLETGLPYVFEYFFYPNPLR